MQLLPNATEAQSNPAIEACAQELLDALPPVMRFLRKHMRARRNSRGLSMPQFRTLALLGSAPSVNLSAVADHMDASLPTASRIVTGLVDRGFIARQECPKDRRQVELALTSKGLQVLDSTRAVAKERLVRELAALDAAQIRGISRAMSLLHTIFAPGLHGDSDCSADSRAKTPRPGRSNNNGSVKVN